MLDKYRTEFEEMYERIIRRENPLNVIGEYLSKFEGEGIGMLGIAHYFGRYYGERRRG